MNGEQQDDEAQSSDVVRKHVARGETTVGSYGENASWRDKLTGLFGKKTAIAVGGSVAAAGMIITGNGDKIGDATDTVGQIVSKPIELILPDISEEFTTPQEILAGTMDVRIDRELKGRKAPNDTGDIVNWKKINLITTHINPDTGVAEELPYDLSDKKGFTVDNPLFTHAYNPDGGATPGRWLKLPAKQDGKRFYIYISVSQQTSEFIDINGEFIDINSKQLDGKEAYVAKDINKKIPNGIINDVIPLVEDNK